MPDEGLARDLAITALLRARRAKHLAFRNREPLPRKLTHTVRHRKVLRVVIAASSTRSLVASSTLALGWVRADVSGDSWPGLFAWFRQVGLAESIESLRAALPHCPAS